MNERELRAECIRLRRLISRCRRARWNLHAGPERGLAAAILVRWEDVYLARLESARRALARLVNIHTYGTGGQE